MKKYKIQNRYPFHMSFSQLQGNVLFSLQKLLLTRIYSRRYFEQYKKMKRYTKCLSKNYAVKQLIIN
jgi:hypothetical protein